VDNVVLTDPPEPDEDVPKIAEDQCERWLGGLLSGKLIEASRSDCTSGLRLFRSPVYVQEGSVVNLL
jgi:hypothetical protein